MQQDDLEIPLKMTRALQAPKVTPLKTIGLLMKDPLKMMVINAELDQA